MIYYFLANLSIYLFIVIWLRKEFFRETMYVQIMMTVWILLLGLPIVIFGHIRDLFTNK